MKKFDINRTYDELGLGWTIAVVVIALLVSLGLIFGLICLEAWIFMLLWNWVVPIFWATAPHLGFWVSFGVMMFLNFIGGCFKSRVSVNRD